VRGQHYTAFVADVDRLVRSKRFQVAERLLLELIDATEAEGRIARMGVAPWYYEQLANLYHERGDAGAELAILRRFREQPATPADLRRALLARLKALTARDIRPRAPNPTLPPPGEARACVLTGCQTILVRGQVKYCSAEHHLAARRGRPPNTP